MRPLYLFLALGLGAVWVSCGGSDNSGLFAGTGGGLGASGNVTGGSGQTGSGSSGSNTGAAGAAGGSMGAGGAGGKGSGGAAGQGGSGTAGASGTAGKGGAAGTAGAGMGGGAGSMIVDAGTDARPLPDAGTGPTIRCGTTHCDPDTDFCCLRDPPTCVANNNSNACDRNNDRLHCDDASDCAPNQHCCALDSVNGSPADAVCRMDCNISMRRTQTLCDPAAQQCTTIADPTCSANDQGILPSYSYCH